MLDEWTCAATRRANSHWVKRDRSFRILVFECIYVPGRVQWASSCRLVDTHGICNPVSYVYTRMQLVRENVIHDRTDRARCVCTYIYTNVSVYECMSLGKLRYYKGSAPSSIANIDLNHKDRPPYPIVRQPTYCTLSLSFSSSPYSSSLSLSLSISSPLPPAPYRLYCAQSVLSFFNGNDLSIHLFRTVYVPLVAFRPNAACAPYK